MILDPTASQMTDTEEGWADKAKVPQGGTTLVMSLTLQAEDVTQLRSHAYLAPLLLCPLPSHHSPESTPSIKHCLRVCFR